MTDRFYTPSELGAIFKVNKRTIIRMISCGQIKAVSVGSSKGRRTTWRILQAEVDRYIAEQYEKKEKESKDGH